MENSTELCENVSVTASENTNNSEIEAKTIEEENKMSEEVSKETSETKEKEVKTLETNKAFKWTNEATKAAACMLKDIIDEFNEANSDLSSSIDENTDPWGFDKLNEQIKVLKQSRELDLFPEEWCRFKLASVIKKYFDKHCKALCYKKIKFEQWRYEDKEKTEIKVELNNYFEYDLHYLYFALSEFSKNNINFEGIAEGIMEEYWATGADDESLRYFGYIPYDDVEDYYENYIKNPETKAVADELSNYCPVRFDLEEKPDEDRKKFEKALSIPEDFQVFYLVDLIKKIIYESFPKFEDIDKIKGLKLGSDKNYSLMLRLAECSYRSIDFLNIADAFIADEINNLKGIKETYSSIFEE